MTKEEFRREKLYLATMDLAMQLLKSRTISREDYLQFDTKMKAKYRPKSGSLLSGKPLIVSEVSALMGVGKEAGNGGYKEDRTPQSACSEEEKEGRGIRPGFYGE